MFRSRVIITRSQQSGTTSGGAGAKIGDGGAGGVAKRAGRLTPPLDGLSRRGFTQVLHGLRCCTFIALLAA